MEVLESGCSACFVLRSSFVHSTILSLENDDSPLQLAITREINKCAHHFPHLYEIYKRELILREAIEAVASHLHFQRCR